jgi:hypothetical protein
VKDSIAASLSPFRGKLLALHGMVGMLLPNLGFAYLFVSLDMVFGMCHHGRTWQCLAHIGLSCSGTPIGIITLMNALYPHSRLLVVVWHRALAASSSAWSDSDVEEARGLLSGRRPPAAFGTHTNPLEEIDCNLAAVEQQHDQCQAGGAGSVAEHTVLLTGGGNYAQSRAGHGQGSDNYGEALTASLTGSDASVHPPSYKAWAPSPAVHTHVLPIDKHLRSVFPGPGLSWDMSSAFIAYITIPVAAAVVVSNILLAGSAVPSGEGGQDSSSNGTAAMAGHHRGLEVEMDMGGGDAPIEGPPDGHLAHSDIQHVMLGVIGVACFVAELVLRMGPPAFRTGVNGGVWVVPRACFFVTVGFAMGMHHQHSAMAGTFHAVAGQHFAAAGVLLLLESALVHLVAIPEVEQGRAALAEGRGEAFRLDGSSKRGARGVILVASSPAASRVLMLQRLLGVARGVLLLFSSMMFLGSADSSQKLGQYLLPSAWSAGLFFTVTIITIMWWLALAACVQVGAMPPHWPTVRQQATKEISLGGWNRMPSALCCCCA